MVIPWVKLIKILYRKTCRINGLTYIFRNTLTKEIIKNRCYGNSTMINIRDYRIRWTIFILVFLFEESRWNQNYYSSYTLYISFIEAFVLSKVKVIVSIATHFSIDPLHQIHKSHILKDLFVLINWTWQQYIKKWKY